MVGQEYVDDTVAVRHSAVQGRGVFAVRQFASGQQIRAVDVLREVTLAAPLRPELGELPEHCADHDGHVVLYGVPDRYYNHSCDPNAWVRHVDGRVEIVARRTIEAGEEIRVDYLINNSGGDSWPCHCGTARCREMTSVSFFTLPTEQQREYLPLLANWFEARHHTELAELRRRLDA